MTPFSAPGSWGQGAAVAGTARDYNYDPIGNRVADQSGSYAVNALNQYTASPGVAALTYDLAGNLTSDGTRSYTFDAENRVASVVQGGVTSTFKYDYLGRRIAKTVGAVETRYVYDGWNLIAELAPTTFAIQRTYTWGLDASGSLQGAGGVGGLLCIASGANRYYPIYDGSFNVIGLYDGTGAMAAAYRYDPCGNLLQSTGVAATVNPFGFSTKFTDRETGLIYYGLRYYHAPLGRFINRDPIEEAGGINLYAFCGNDGVNRWDMLGLDDDAPPPPPPPPKIEDDPMNQLPPMEVNGGSQREAREQYERTQRDNAANDLDQALRNSGDNPVISEGHSSFYYGAVGVAQSFVDATARSYTYGLWSPYSSAFLYGTGAVNPSGDIRFCNPAQYGARIGQAIQQLGLMAMGGALSRLSAVSGAAENVAPQLGSLTPSQARQIQAFTDRFGAEVNLVGSRASGTAEALSDFDYVIGGNAKLRNAAEHFLPRGAAGGEIRGGMESGIDILNANKIPLDPSRPFIKFTPGQAPVVGGGGG